MLEACDLEPPQYSGFLRQMYAADSHLLFGEHLITSERRAQQGDPADPLVFRVGVHPMVNYLTAELNLWYLDDGTLGGDPATLIRDVRTVLAAPDDYGFELNLSECDAYISGGSESRQEMAWTKLCQAANGIRRVFEPDLYE